MDRRCGIGRSRIPLGDGIAAVGVIAEFSAAADQTEEALVQRRAHVGVAVLELGVEIQPLQRGRLQVQLLRRNYRALALIQVVGEVAITRGIGDAILQRRGARAAAVEPGESQCHRRAIGERPGIEGIQSVRRVARVVLKELCVAERGLFVDTKIGAKTIAIQRIVRPLVGQRLGALDRKSVV